MSAPFSIDASYARIRRTLDLSNKDVLPSLPDIKRSTTSVPHNIPSTGIGEEATLTHILHDLVPGFNGPKTSANYYGFVTGGVLPIAEVADNIVTAWDQNVQVHLPEQSVSTAVEDRALSMLVELLDLGLDEWAGRTFTTGATGANVLGLACGREACLRRTQGADNSVGELGILEACRRAGIEEIQVLTTMGHSSLSKAASIVGLGRASVHDVGDQLGWARWTFDMEALKRRLGKAKTASIVVVSCGEVNTGRFATNSFEEMKALRELCNEYGAWLHVDGAFALFSRSLPTTSEFATIRRGCEGIELADSITGDAHKCLNVPYDCGFFLTRHPAILPSVFQNPNAAYLSAATSSIPSPLNIGLENSRRFRALPVYAVLLAHGRAGLAEMLARQVRLARGVAKFIDLHTGYELLPKTGKGEDYDGTGIIVLFRAKDDQTNGELVARINRTGKIYVSGTAWDQKPACRIAVSTWKVDVERDLETIKTVLEAALL